jgi:hypothetical protein
MPINPAEDGYTHINVYSKGRTELGRLLTNFADTPFHHPDYGWFASMECYWYWVGTGKQHDDLRDLYGYPAKEYGRRYERITCPDFQFDIEAGLFYKIAQHPDLAQRLINSNLPFAHYYLYGGTKVVVPSGSEWLLLQLEALRDNLKFRRF